METQEIQLFERSLLLNTSPSTNLISNEEELLNGQYQIVINNVFYKSSILSSSNEDFELEINEKIYSNVINEKEWFCCGIASLLYFIKNNFVETLNNEDVDCLLSLKNKAITNLSLNNQINENVVKSELLFVAKIILNHEQILSNFPSASWWLIRLNLIHQLIFDEASAILFEESERLIDKLHTSTIMDDAALKTLFCAEVSQFYLYYGRIQISEKYLMDAKISAKLNFELKGALGKRTKHQLQEKPQLYLTAEVDKNLFPFRACDGLPKVESLSDDVLLEKIEFSEEKESVKLGSFEEALIMIKFFQLQLSQPKGDLRNEEIIPYLDFIIENTKNWALKISALFQRSILESSNKRTIYRALAQVEYLTEQLSYSKTPTAHRMDLFFTSGIKPIWFFKKHLAKLRVDTGLIKAALDLYFELNLWQDVIFCYTLLGMKYKAAEIIRQELNKKPTVKLWCLLGDATQEVEHYETAWKFSGEKSSCVQRHWGYYYYSKQKYKEAIPHLKLSVELNNIQENVWMQLGFAALQIKDWNLAVSAYKKYCALEQSSFEAWNDLGKAYFELGDLTGAQRSFQEAIKCNFDQWKVWDNLMIASALLKNFSEVVRCYNRILDLKATNHIDMKILTVLSRSIINNFEDSDESSARKYLQKTLELFGRLTASVTTNTDLWRLYAELTLLKRNKIDDQRAAQYFQKAYRASISNDRWHKTVEGVNEVLSTCTHLVEMTITSFNKFSQVQKREILGSAKLTLQTVIKKVKDLKWDDTSKIKENFNKLEQHFQVVLEEFEKV